MTEHPQHDEHSHANDLTADSGHTHRYGRGIQDELRDPATALRRAIPEVYQSFNALHSAAYADGALDRKTKELIALAIATVDHCDGCISSHARGAARAGASEAEVAEMLGVCIQMMGGPGTVYGPRAFAAYRDFAAYYAARG